MNWTGQMANPDAMLGQIVPGFTGVLSLTAHWQGPFTPAQVSGLGPVPYQQLAAGGYVTVPAAIASQMAAADSTWWTFY